MNEIFDGETHNSFVDCNRRNLGNQINGPLVIDLLLQPGDGEPDVARVGLVELLPGVGLLVVRHHGEAGAQAPAATPLHLRTQSAQGLTCQSHAFKSENPIFQKQSFVVVDGFDRIQHILQMAKSSTILLTENRHFLTTSILNG